MPSKIDNLKQHVFYEMLDLADRVFLHVRYSEDVKVGKRGFLPDEKEKGIILVFNRQMNFRWDESGITATLVFGPKTEKCFIPIDRIVSIFSPELHAQFSVSLEDQEIPRPKTATILAKKPYSKEKVVRLDFNRKK